MSRPFTESLRCVGLAAFFLLGACSEAGNQAGPAPATTAPEATAQAASGQSSTSTSVAQGEFEQRFPDVVAVSFEVSGDGTYRFDVTLSSPYDTAERYADAWRIVGPDGEVLGTRELAHDHASEQPFTRSLAGVAIPEEVTLVLVEARDQENGWGGVSIEVEVRAS